MAGMTTALVLALEKVTGTQAAFIECCAQRWTRDKICKRWGLSYEQHDALVRHFGAEIRAWPNDPVTVAAAARNVLPPEDRA
jgi:hypothetical protein